MNAITKYLPASDADRVIWLNNFSVKIGTYAASVGITSAEVTAIQKDSAMYQYVMNMLEVYKQTVNNLVGYKNLLKHAVGQQHLGVLSALPALATAPATVAEGVFDRIGSYVKRIKAAAGYTDNIGHDLGIVAPVSVFDPNSLQPELTVKLDAGRPHIKCSKGITDAIDLYVDRNDGSGWVLIGRLIKPDYIDTANLPAGTAVAEWSYKAMYVIGNDSVGLMSSVESILVKKL